PGCGGVGPGAGPRCLCVGGELCRTARRGPRGAGCAIRRGRAVSPGAHGVDAAIVRAPLPGFRGRGPAGRLTLRVRRAASEDAPAVAELFLDSFHATYEFPLAHTDDEVRGWVRDHLIPEAETWVAIDDERAVALLVVAPGWIEQLYVEP